MTITLHSTQFLFVEHNLCHMVCMKVSTYNYWLQHLFKYLSVSFSKINKWRYNWIPCKKICYKTLTDFSEGSRNQWEINPIGIHYSITFSVKQNSPQNADTQPWLLFTENYVPSFRPYSINFINTKKSKASWRVFISGVKIDWTV